MLQDKIGNPLEDLGIGKDFLTITQTTQQINRNNKKDYVHLRSFYIAKETTKSRDNLQDAIFFPGYSFDRGLIPMTYRELKQNQTLQKKRIHQKMSN